MEAVKILSNVSYNNLIKYIQSLKKVEKILKTIFNFMRQINYSHFYVFKILKLYSNFKKYILTFKNFLLTNFKQQNTLYFNEHQKNLVKEWLIQYVFEFETSNTFTLKNENSMIKYEKTTNINSLLVTEPKSNSIIHLENTKINYVLGDTYITLYHVNKIILDNVLEKLLYFIKTNQKSEQKIYNPKIFNINSESKDNKVQYFWKLENTIYETIKIFFKDKDLEQLLTPFENFYSNHELYNDIGLPYKLVACFMGKPGLGKTTIVKYLAKKYSKDIYMFSHFSFDSSIFLKLYQAIPKDSIILFEDFDKFSHLSYTYQSYVTPLLNILDGVLTQHGTTIIFCLNDKNFLEKNFPTITRVGRIDHYQDFDLFDKDITKLVVKQIYSAYTENEVNEYIELLKEKNILLQTSELKNKCLKASRNLSTAIKLLKNENQS